MLRARLAALAEGLPRPFWFLLGGQLVNRLGYFVEPFLALYLVTARGLSEATAGLLLGLLGVGSICSQGIGGLLTDGLGRRATMVGGMLATAAAILLLGASEPLWLIAVATLAVGLTIDLYRPAASALIADLVAPEHRARAFGLQYWAVNLGVAIAVTVGGALAERSFELVFALDAATTVVCALVLLRSIPETRPTVPFPGPGAGGRGYGAVLRDPLLLTTIIGTLVYAVAIFQGFVTLPLVMRLDGYGPGDFGLIYAVNPVVILVVQPLVLPRLAARSLPMVAATSLVVTGVGLGLNLVASTLPTYALAVAVWTLGEIGVTTVLPTLVAGLAPAALRGRYQGAFGLSFSAAFAIGPPLGGLVLARLGAPPLWAGCLVLCLAAAALFRRAAPALERRLSSPAS